PLRGVPEVGQFPRGRRAIDSVPHREPWPAGQKVPHLQQNRPPLRPALRRAANLDRAARHWRPARTASLLHLAGHSADTCKRARLVRQGSGCGENLELRWLPDNLQSLDSNPLTFAEHLDYPGHVVWPTQGNGLPDRVRSDVCTPAPSAVPTARRAESALLAPAHRVRQRTRQIAAEALPAKLHR